MKSINYSSKHRGKSYTIENIPKTSSYDELIFIINYCLRNSNEYNKLAGKFCGEKANNLLTTWGYITPQYEIY